MLPPLYSLENDAAAKFSHSVNAFSFKLFNALKAGRTKENIIASGLSLYSVLGAALLGAKGETASELRRALQRNVDDATDTDSGYAQLITQWKKNSEATVRVENKMLLEDGLIVVEQYREDLKLFYDCDVEEKNFVHDSAEIIRDCNAWIAGVTNNMITSMLDYLEVDTQFVLLNAVYFKGQWKEAFDPCYTMQQIFYNHGTEDVFVQMMYAYDVECSRSSFTIANEEFDVCELPYKGNFSFAIILPKSKTYFRDHAAFDFEAVERMQQTFPSSSATATVALPKMKFETDHDNVIDALRNIGIHKAFADGDFTGIAEEGNVSISRAFHKAVIEVNEEGTEAAAASGIVADSCGSDDFLYVGHPFMFVIRDEKSRAILFIGQVNEL